MSDDIEREVISSEDINLEEAGQKQVQRSFSGNLTDCTIYVNPDGNLEIVRSTDEETAFILAGDWSRKSS